MIKGLVCLFAGAMSAAQSVRANDDLSAEDAAVLSTIVQSICNRYTTDADSRFMVLADHADVIHDDQGKDSLNREAVVSLNNRNSISHALPKLELCPSIRLASNDEIRAGVDRYLTDDYDYVGAFRQAFPGSFGPVSVSLPGYAERGQIAVVVLANAGGSFYYVLRKQEGKWRVERTQFRSIA